MISYPSYHILAKCMVLMKNLLNQMLYFPFKSSILNVPPNIIKSFLRGQGDIERVGTFHYLNEYNIIAQKYEGYWSDGWNGVQYEFINWGRAVIWGARRGLHSDILYWPQYSTHNGYTLINVSKKMRDLEFQISLYITHSNMTKKHFLQQ